MLKSKPPVWREGSALLSYGNGRRAHCDGLYYICSDSEPCYGVQKLRTESHLEGTYTVSVKFLHVRIPVSLKATPACDVERVYSQYNVGSGQVCYSRTLVTGTTDCALLAAAWRIASAVSNESQYHSFMTNIWY